MWGKKKPQTFPLRLISDSKTLTLLHEIIQVFFKCYVSSNLRQVTGIILIAASPSPLPHPPKRRMASPVYFSAETLLEYAPFFSVLTANWSPPTQFNNHGSFFTSFPVILLFPLPKYAMLARLSKTLVQSSQPNLKMSMVPQCPYKILPLARN